MRVTIEVESDQELERVASFLREQGVAVQVGGDGGGTSPRLSRQAFLEELRQFQGTIPPDYTFDRDEIHDRHG